MADLSTIFQALQASSAAAKQSNPYAGFQAIPDQVGQAVLQNSANYTDSENFLGPLILGMLSGGAEHLGDTYQDNQNSLARQVIVNAMQGGDVTRPDGMSPSVFSSLENAGTLFNLENKISQANDAQKDARAMKSNIIQEIVKGAVANPYQSKRAAQALQELFGGAPGSASGPTAESQTEREQLLEKYQGRQEMADAEQRRNLEAPDRNRADEDTLRTAFENKADVKELGVISNALSSLEKSVNDPSKVSDLAFTYGIMKILDPNSIVRESEQGMVIDSQSLDQGMLGRIRGMVSGKQTLGPAVRADLLRLAQTKYDVTRAAVDSLASQYRDIATRRGLNYRNIVTIPGTNPADYSRAMATPAASSLGSGSVAMPPAMPSAPSADPSQGGTLKRQVNVKTGETRWVPR